MISELMLEEASELAEEKARIDKKEEPTKFLFSWLLWFYGCHNKQDVEANSDAWNGISHTQNGPHLHCMASILDENVGIGHRRGIGGGHFSNLYQSVWSWWTIIKMEFYKFAWFKDFWLGIILYHILCSFLEIFLILIFLQKKHL